MPFMRTVPPTTLTFTAEEKRRLDGESKPINAGEENARHRREKSHNSPVAYFFISKHGMLVTSETHSNETETGGEEGRKGGKKEASLPSEKRWRADQAVSTVLPGD